MEFAVPYFKVSYFSSFYMDKCIFYDILRPYKILLLIFIIHNHSGEQSLL